LLRLEALVRERGKLVSVATLPPDNPILNPKQGF
jgi:hypothetical protein